MSVTQNDLSHGSATQEHIAQALWHSRPGVCELRSEALQPLGQDEVCVKADFSGISRGTERLVLSGHVPVSEREHMRAPFQAGPFSFPVKYGYSAAGRIIDGPPDGIGQRVFCLYPHQDTFVVPSSAVTLVPDHIPLRRATLAANMETALNALWDAGVQPGSDIAVVGGGVVGLLTAHLAARMPGVIVTLVDNNPLRSAIAEDLGLRFVLPGDLPRDCDVVFHTSASGGGLDTAIACAGIEATVLEMSWYGDRAISAHLGGPLHSKRLRLVASQVGRVAPTMRSRWSLRRRLDKAISLLDDSRLDCIVASDLPFANAAEMFPKVLASDYVELPPVINYGRDSRNSFA
ncbi:MAG: zinc-dependent alcohol dehydrogenase [Hyphomicrobiaceae bacterium]